MSFYEDQGFNALDKELALFKAAVEAEEWERAEGYLAALIEQAIGLQGSLPHRSSSIEPFDLA